MSNINRRPLQNQVKICGKGKTLILQLETESTDKAYVNRWQLKPHKKCKLHMIVKRKPESWSHVTSVKANSTWWITNLNLQSFQLVWVWRAKRGWVGIRNLLSKQYLQRNLSVNNSTTLKEPYAARDKV